MAIDYRLKREKDFNLVFRKGKRAFSRDLTMVYFPSKEIKVGFAVSKKHGGSVKRNKIKRLLRESFRSFMPYFGKNFFFVFIPKVENEYTLTKFKQDMAYIFKKGGLIEDAKIFKR